MDTSADRIWDKVNAGVRFTMEFSFWKYFADQRNRDNGKTSSTNMLSRMRRRKHKAVEGINACHLGDRLFELSKSQILGLQLYHKEHWFGRQQQNANIELITSFPMLSTPRDLRPGMNATRSLLPLR